MYDFHKNEILEKRRTSVFLSYSRRQIHTVMGWILSPLRICWSPNPWLLWMWRIWKYSFYRFNQIKMRSLGPALIQYDPCPCEKRKSEHRARHARERLRQRLEWCISKPWNSQDCQGELEVRKSQGRISPLKPWGRARPSPHFDFSLLDFRTVR